MNSLTDLQDEEMRSGSPNREITLGTTLILGIFFAIAAVCAAFFGFGYSLGIKHSAAVNVAADAQPSVRLSGTKPAAGSAAAASKPFSADNSSPPSRPESAAAKPVSEASVEPIQTEPPSTRARSVPEPTPASTTLAATPPGGMQFLVQIAAVTHGEDADLIASTLTRRGYAVSIRPELQDKLLHVQVGPFATKKDADAMRQRLLADGFNAFVK